MTSWPQTYPLRPGPVAVCPHCRTCFDAATNMLEPGGPAPGDVSMCVECGEFAVFDDDMRQRVLTAEEAAIVDRNPDVAKIKELWRRRPRRR